MNIETIKQLKAMTSLGSSSVEGLKGICFTETKFSLTAKIFNGEVLAQLNLKPTGVLIETAVDFKHLGATLSCAVSDVNFYFSPEGNLILSEGLNATLNKVVSFELEDLTLDGYEKTLEIERQKFLDIISKSLLFAEKRSDFSGIKFYNINGKLVICAGSSQNILISRTEEDFKLNFVVDYENLAHVFNLLKNTSCDLVEIFKNETSVLFRFCDFLVKTPLLIFKQKMSPEFVTNFESQLKLCSVYKIYKSSLVTAFKLAVAYKTVVIQVHLEEGGLRISEETELGKFEHVIPTISKNGESRIIGFKTPIDFINKILGILPEQIELGIYVSGKHEVPVLKLEDNIFLSLIKE